MPVALVEQQHSYTVYASYHQFYLRDRASPPDEGNADFWGEEAFKAKLALGSSGLVASEKIERSGLKQPFLGCYDYGQGGLWAWVIADRATRIREAYPELTVFDRMPRWMTPDMLHGLQSCDLDAGSTGLLAILDKNRGA